MGLLEYNQYNGKFLQAPTSRQCSINLKTCDPNLAKVLLAPRRSASLAMLTPTTSCHIHRCCAGERLQRKRLREDVWRSCAKSSEERPKATNCRTSVLNSGQNFTARNCPTGGSRLRKKATTGGRNKEKATQRPSSRSPRFGSLDGSFRK